MIEDDRILTAQEQKDIAMIENDRSFEKISFRNLPEESRTNSLIMFALEVWGDNIRLIDEKKRTDEMYLRAFKSDSRIIGIMPKRLISDEIADTAIRIDGDNLGLLDKEMRTKDRCMAALMDIPDITDLHCLNIIRYIPHNEICLAMMKEIAPLVGAYEVLELIDKNVIDANIALEAVCQDSGCEELIPDSVKQEDNIYTFKLRLDQAGNNKFTPEQISTLYKGRSLELKSLLNNDDSDDILVSFDKEQNRYHYKPTPRQEQKDIDIIKKKDWDSIIHFQSLPRERRTERVSMEAVKKSAYNLAHVPEEVKTPEMCRIALTSSPNLEYADVVILAHIPFPDVCLEGLKAYSKAKDAYEMMQVIPSQAIDDRVVDWALEEDPACFKILPPEKKTMENAMKAVQGGTRMLHSIPKNLQTNELVREAKMADLVTRVTMSQADITPERCVEIAKSYPDFFKRNPELLPGRISQTQNAYTLYQNQKTTEKQEKKDEKPVKQKSKRHKM